MKYRKKPVEVEAVQYTGKNYKEIKRVFPNIILYVSKECSIGTMVTEAEFDILPVRDLYVVTLEGNMRISLYDFIIKGVNGEFYSCRLDIFEQTYEKVEEI